MIGMADPPYAIELSSPEVIVPLMLVVLSGVRFGWRRTSRYFIIPGAGLSLLAPAVLSLIVLDCLAAASLIGIGLVFHYFFLDGLPCESNPNSGRTVSTITWITCLDGIASILLVGSSAFFMALLATRLP